MQRQAKPAILGLAIFSLFAMACVAYTVALGQLSLYFVAGAALLLAVGQIALVFALWGQARSVADGLAAAGRERRDAEQDVGALAVRLDAAEQNLAAIPSGPSPELMQEIKALRDGVAALMADLAKPRPAAPIVAAETAADASPAVQPAAPAAEAAARGAEKIELLLEPVIELASGTTVHYRAQVNLVDAGGNAVSHDALMAKADEGGLRPSLDARLLELALPVLRRLRVKHLGMRLFAPLGAATLQTEADVARIVGLIERQSDVAASVVFEIAQDTLAGLHNAGIAGLAKLARLGVQLALAGVREEGLDLASLRQIGVRFLQIDADAMESGSGASSGWLEFTRYAKAMQFLIMAGGVQTAAEAGTAARVARYGYGAYFAPARRVRADAGREAPAGQTRAA